MKPCTVWGSIRKAFSMFAEFRFACTRRTRTFQFHFLLSSKGYGILWNNPSLTDFNPADQSIEIDPDYG